MKNLFFIALGLLLIQIASQVSATSHEFLSTIKAHYAIGQDGHTTVTYDITVKNNSSLSYPQEFQLIIDSPDVTQAVAHDSYGQITPTVIKNGESTTIGVKFHKPIVGLESSLPFTLRYQTNDIAKKSGNIWTITIPKIPNDPSIEEYSVTFDAPQNFGELAYIYPKPSDGRRFTHDQLVHQRVTAVYGSSKFYKLQIRYDLNNSSPAIASKSIRLPPDTAFQKISIETLEPLPHFVSQDAQGHWIGKYSLNPYQSLSINANLIAEITYHPRSTWEPSPPDQLNVFEAQSDNTLTAIAEDLGTPEAIYSYVTNMLSYNYLQNGATTNRSALEILRDPHQSKTSDFVMVFTTLLQNAGIHTRKVFGLAISDSETLEPIDPMNKNLHVWAEYFDPQYGAWFPADPTWGNTGEGKSYIGELDFKHITLRLGEEVPTESEDITEISSLENISYEIPVENPEIEPGKLTGILKFPLLTVSGFGAYGSLSLKNLTGLSLHSIRANVTTQNNTLVETEEELTPYSEKSIPFYVPIRDFYSFGKRTLVLNVNDETTTYTYMEIPFIPILILLVILFLFGKIFILIVPKATVIAHVKKSTPKKVWKFKKKK